MTCQSTTGGMATDLPMGRGIKPNCAWLAPADSWLSSNSSISIVAGEGASLMACKVGHGKDWTAYSNMLSNKGEKKSSNKQQRFLLAKTAGKRHEIIINLGIRIEFTL